MINAAEYHKHLEKLLKLIDKEKSEKDFSPLEKYVKDVKRIVEIRQNVEAEISVHEHLAHNFKQNVYQESDPND